MKKITFPDEAMASQLHLARGQIDVFIGDYQRVGYVVSAQDSPESSGESVEEWHLEDGCHLEETLQDWGGLDEPMEFVSETGQTVGFFIPERQLELDHYDRFDQTIRPEKLKSYDLEPWEGKSLTDLLNGCEWPVQ